ncbi:MAG: fprA [Frankiales bacterium]|nr:fprA [Frankiales bacterium]
MSEPPLRVAVVGAGPAGLYTADALTFDEEPAVEVDLLERLPVPFGLLRYGVAPDHLNIKAAGNTLQGVLEREPVELFCHVGVGTDVTVAELRERYDAVVYAVGASVDRTLGIPGEQLPGSSSATQFVNWYNGHPEQVVREVLDATTVAVIGIGNVALDVARLLLKDPDDLLHTDIPQPAIEVLRASAVTDVHIVGRRGPEHAKFTPKELKELGELPGVDVVVDPTEIPADPEDAKPPTKRNLAVLREWAARRSTGAPRRLHLHFGATPLEVLGEAHVTGLRLSTGDLPCQLVLRSVGYRSLPLPDVPFDDETGTIPSEGSRVVRDGRAEPGEYVVGWVRRGATGILGTNRSDAMDAVASLHEDLPALLARRTRAPEGIEGLLAARGVEHVSLQGWAAIVEREHAHGAEHGRSRVKIADLADLLEAAGVNP